MVLLIARKELAIVLADGRIRTLGVVLVVMLLMAIAAAMQRYAVISNERGVAQSLVAEQWEQQGEKNPHAAAHYGLYAFRPVGPLTFFDTGVSSHQGVSVWLEAHRRNFAEASPAADLGSVARFGEMTGAFVLQTLLPLLAILLCYAAFAGERENGTLRQVLATGVRPLQLLSGKALGALGAVFGLLLPVVALALVALMFSGSAIGALPRALLLTLAYGAYATMKRPTHGTSRACSRACRRNLRCMIWQRCFRRAWPCSDSPRSFPRQVWTRNRRLRTQPKPIAASSSRCSIAT